LKTIKLATWLESAFAVQVKPSGKPEELKQKSVSKADTTVDSQAEAQQAAPQKLEANAAQKPGPTRDSHDKQQVARDSSKTVFVRSLPPDVSQDQLNLAFTKFGKLRACR
jgi:RNA recognition motif-containing protein